MPKKKRQSFDEAREALVELVEERDRAYADAAAKRDVYLAARDHLDQTHLAITDAEQALYDAVVGPDKHKSRSRWHL